MHRIADLIVMILVVTSCGHEPLESARQETQSSHLVPACGNRNCQSGESAGTCPQDCPAVCGDASCTHDEVAATCGVDCPAVCGDGACTHLEAAPTCAADCPAVCGDGACTHDEGAPTCGGDCPAVCGDGACTHDERWQTCSDCPYVDECHTVDGICDPELGEGCASCEVDCGPCSIDSICGNGVCEADPADYNNVESAQNCRDDCLFVPNCGDHHCELFETAANCPSDCP